MITFLYPIIFLQKIQINVNGTVLITPFRYCRKDSQSYIVLGFAFFGQVIKDDQLVFNKVTIVHLLFLISFASKIIFLEGLKRKR